MRNHQQTDHKDATIAKLGDATFVRDSSTAPYWKFEHECMRTDQLIRYGATFWKPIEPEPGYRLVTDEERVGEKPKGCRYFYGGRWVDVANLHGGWSNTDTYAVPIKQVVAVACGVDYNSEWHMAKFQTPDIRDRAVREANEREL